MALTLRELRGRKEWWSFLFALFATPQALGLGLLVYMWIESNQPEMRDPGRGFAVGLASVFFSLLLLFTVPITVLCWVKKRRYEGEWRARTGKGEPLTAGILTDAHVEGIANLVRPFAGQAYEVATYWGLTEAVALADSIHHALLHAGWTSSKSAERSILPGGVVGARVYVHPEADEHVKAAAAALVAALSAAQIETKLRQQPTSTPPNNKLSLHIGLWP